MPVLYPSLLFVIVLLLGAVTVFLYRFRKDHSGGTAHSLETLETPLTRLSFEESLDPTRFSEAALASATGGLSRVINRAFGDGAVVTVHGVRHLPERTEITVSLSVSGRRLLRSGRGRIPLHRASGRRLPVLVDRETGKILEHFREVPRLRSALVNISGMAIGAAHLVSSADVAKRLSGVESKLDCLLATRRFDQLARLERIYFLARELSGGPIDETARRELRHLRGELRELRASWRHEFRYKLQQIEDPENLSWLRRRLSSRHAEDRRVADGITQGQEEIALLEYSMRLEHLLAVVSGTVDQFLDSQGGEIQQLQKLRDLLREKADYIRGDDADMAAGPLVDSLSQLTAAYERLLPERGQTEPRSLTPG